MFEAPHFPPLGRKHGARANIIGRRRAPCRKNTTRKNYTRLIYYTINKRKKQPHQAKLPHNLQRNFAACKKFTAIRCFNEMFHKTFTHVFYNQQQNSGK
jgi:hypothetical protein